MAERDNQFNFEKLVKAYENVIRHGYILYEVKKVKKNGFDGEGEYWGYWYEIVLEDEKACGHVRIQVPSDNVPTTNHVYFNWETIIDSIDVNSDSICVITELLLTMKDVLGDDGGKKVVLEFFDRLYKEIK